MTETPSPAKWWGSPYPWTETPRDRDPPDKEPPLNRDPPWTETPPGQRPRTENPTWTEPPPPRDRDQAPLLDRDPLD